MAFSSELNKNSIAPYIANELVVSPGCTRPDNTIPLLDVNFLGPLGFVIVNQGTRFPNTVSHKFLNFTNGSPREDIF